MSLVPTTPVIVYVAHAERGRRVSFGVYFDSMRWKHLNLSAVMDEHSSSDYDAVLGATQYVLQKVPRYHNVIIETAQSDIVQGVNAGLLRRKRSDPASDGLRIIEEEAILDLIEMRNHRGDCFVDIVCSLEDPSAKKGLDAAHALAVEALT